MIKQNIVGILRNTTFAKFNANAHFSMSMTLRSISVTVLLLLNSAYSSIGCDICGCSSSNQSLGLLPQFSEHFIGLQYLYGSSESTHPALIQGNPDEHSSQYYNTIQIWGRYQIAKRIQLFAFIPYVNNINNDGVNRIRTSGIGDASLIANVSLLNTKQNEGRRILLIGGGLKLPTGHYTGITEADKQGLPNMQTGTGSYDFIVNANYTVRQKKWGYNLDASYIWTTANNTGYKYGNKLNSSFVAFYWLEYKKSNIVPQIGARCEYTLHDYDNYAQKWLNEQSGGYVTYISGGVQVFYKKIGAKLMLHIPIPVVQNYATHYVQIQSRTEAGLFFLL